MAGHPTPGNGGVQAPVPAHLEGADRFGESRCSSGGRTALDDLLRGAGGVVGDQDGGFVVAEAGDGELPQGAG